MKGLIDKPYLREVSKRYQTTKTASDDLIEKALQIRKSQRNFDVFLSHSFQDAESIRGLKIELESNSLSTYVDWIDDQGILEREEVNEDTAKTLRNRMKDAKVLIYAYSPNSTKSVWMPWELGYSDGLGKPVAIAPLTEEAKKEYPKQEYLKIYPYITRELSSRGTMEYWVNEEDYIYVHLTAWMNGEKPKMDERWKRIIENKEEKEEIIVNSEILKKLLGL